VRLLAVNWQDLENPLAGGAETHLHEILERLAGWGHEVTLLCGGWPGCPPRATRGGVEIHRVGTRQSFPFRARRYFDAHLRSRAFDVLYEDINKVPLFTTRWGVPRVVAVVPHLFGAAAFQELHPVLAAAVWLAERPIPWMYRGVPFQGISETPRTTSSRVASRGRTSW